MNYLTNVTSIVPRLPPAIDGLGDYALNLARQLRSYFNIQTHFIVGNTIWNGATEIEGFPISQVSSHSADALLTLLSSDSISTVLLHYVGYGYAKRGCPIWLVDGLQQWKTLYPKRSLVTMFHEVYASGSPWTSAFWLSSLQQSLAARLAQLSDRLITTLQICSKMLATLSKNKHTHIITLPVFSNIGEPNQLIALSQRERRLVVFGGVNNRIRIYRECQRAISEICEKLKIQEIWDVGDSTGLGLFSISGISILEVGSQPAEKISYILSNSLAGFLDYNPNVLAKSGIFASYCAHRLLPINTQGSTSVFDGIESGKHYWVPDKSLLKEQIQAIANNAYSWYQNHNLSVHSNVFASCLLDTNSN